MPAGLLYPTVLCGGAIEVGLSAAPWSAQYPARRRSSMLSPEDRPRSCATDSVAPDGGRPLPLLDTTSKCLGCGNGLDIDYDYELARERLGEIPPAEREINIWRFEEL